MQVFRTNNLHALAKQPYNIPSSSDTRQSIPSLSRIQLGKNIQLPKVIVRKDRRVPSENVRLGKHSVCYAFAAPLGVVGTTALLRPSSLE